MKLETKGIVDTLNGVAAIAGAVAVTLDVIGSLGQDDDSQRLPDNQRSFEKAGVVLDNLMMMPK